MTLKDWLNSKPRWLKGGLISIVIYQIIWISLAIPFLGMFAWIILSLSFLPESLLAFYPFVFMIKFMDVLTTSGEFSIPSLLGYIYLLIKYFLIGILISRMIIKIKSKKI